MLKAEKRGDIHEAIKFKAALVNPCTNLPTAEGVEEIDIVEKLDDLIEKYLNDAARRITGTSECTYTYDTEYRNFSFFNAKGEEINHLGALTLNLSLKSDTIMDYIELREKAKLMSGTDFFKDAFQTGWEELQNELCTDAFIFL